MGKGGAEENHRVPWTSAAFTEMVCVPSLRQMARRPLWTSATASPGSTRPDATKRLSALSKVSSDVALNGMRMGCTP